MQKFIPFDKLQKKEQKRLSAQRRGTWGSLNPVTKKVENKKRYNRKKMRIVRDDFTIRIFFS